VETPKPSSSANPSATPDPASEVETRILISPTEKQQAYAILNQAFPVPAGASFLDDFPVWRQELCATSFLVGSFKGDGKGGVLAGCAGGRVAWLKHKTGKIPVGLIGAVATRPEYRGEGIATDSVSAAAIELAKRGVACLFLWGSEHALYQRMGFELCGLQKRIPLAQLSILDNVQSNVPVQTGWTDGILNGLMRRNSGLLIAEMDRKWIAAHKNVNWAWTGPASAPTAWIASNRGIDLQNIIHEWGGEPTALLSLLAQARKINPALEILGSPPDLEAAGIPHHGFHPEYMGMARLLDPMRVVRSFHPSFPGEFKETLEGWSVTLGTETVNLSDASLAVLLFRPERFEGEWAKYFPLPIWIWGLDAC
jgi:GNAT superfamily N-acetyltransferase